MPQDGPTESEQRLCELYREELGRSEQREVSLREALALVRINGLESVAQESLDRLRAELAAILHEHGVSSRVPKRRIADWLRDDMGDYPTNVLLAADALACIAHIGRDPILYGYRLGRLVERMTAKVDEYLTVRGIIAAAASKSGGDARRKRSPSWHRRVSTTMKAGQSWSFACKLVGAESGVSARTVQRSTPDLKPKKV